MIQPKVLTQLLTQCQNEFKVQSIFVAATIDGQMIAQVGQTQHQLPQFSTLSIFFDDCKEIGSIQLSQNIKLNYVFVEIEDQSIVLSNFQNLFTLGIASSQNVGMLVLYMNKLHRQLEKIIN
ncbi:unnamed protein product (macronuclear) [Paramecium tetraurelia]|uniref:Roadblock/LAMTOR2 domain-containing protein n=1 Tax=Paramecium tetraurelia TaxID=5888 RepID=A0BTJ1_PARTE|nr:uncharacterized protein GSPATT00032090001 [Paramecium tetraurelia]CAK61858.1 unnamed protein product [Paramecium tetraurelia]|eukprot:XP_001429256.1 hypothetical protein (macronuclear) [Paramecium tetraurelia strain d4-2]